MHTITLFNLKSQMRISIRPNWKNILCFLLARPSPHRHTSCWIRCWSCREHGQGLFSWFTLFPNKSWISNCWWIWIFFWTLITWFVMGFFCILVSLMSFNMFILVWVLLICYGFCCFLGIFMIFDWILKWEVQTFNIYIYIYINLRALVCLQAPHTALATSVAVSFDVWCGGGLGKQSMEADVWELWGVSFFFFFLIRLLFD